MLSGLSFSENSKRASKKRRRLSERRRVFSRLGVTGPVPDSAFSSDGRRSSNLGADSQVRPDSPVSAALAAANDQTKITMKIQFHITHAPENEPLILDSSSHLISQQQQQQQQQKRQLSSDSNSLISEVIGDRLNRLNSSTRKRQQLLAMHQQTAMDRSGTNRTIADNGRQHSDEQQSFRSGSFSAGTNLLRMNDYDSSHQATGREAGLRSSTITDGIQDERTMRFLNKQQQQQLRQTSGGSLTSNSASSLLGQHQTLMASSNNIRQRLEQREHIYFKRDGQRFGHEFTLKLAVDRNYRCLLKVRPLIPLQSISIHGHHVSFVDCNQGIGVGIGGGMKGPLGDSPLSLHSTTGFGSESAASASPLAASAASNNTSGSSGYTSLSSSSCPASRYTTTRHQSIGGPPIGAGNTSASNRSKLFQDNANNSNPASNHLNSDDHHHQQQHNSASLSSLGCPTALGPINQKQLIKQQQHNQMLRHFSTSHGSGSHLGSQLVYMFDWSAGRFEVTKNKARTTIQTVLKFKNGELLSLPLQVKFYQPECRQHLSWGSQLHFIDYECQINSMGQMSVGRVQYY